MDMSLTITVTCLKISTHDAETHSEGSVCQNFDLGFKPYYTMRFRYVALAIKPNANEMYMQHN